MSILCVTVLSSIVLLLLQALQPLGIGVATGEMCQNRIMFKQFLMSGAMQYCQIDSCRVGGVSENVAIILMAKKFGGMTALSFLFFIILYYRTAYCVIVS